MYKKFPYETVVDPASVDIDASLLKKIENEFLRQQHKGDFPGGQLVVRRKGKLVLKISCGVIRNSEPTVQVEETTPFPVYSTGKPMAAITIAMLESQGLIDVNSRIVDILPEFEGKGRDNITIRDVLTHRAGILLPELIHNHKLWAKRDEVWQFLLDRAPRYPRGTFAYMPGEYGIILDRIVSDITGRTLADFFQQELAAPLGLNNMQYGLGRHSKKDIAWSSWLGKERCIIAGMNVADGFEEKNNDDAVFASANPAFSMVTDAANLAAFYELLIRDGVTRTGNQLIPEHIIKKYTTKQTSGWNKSVNAYLSLGYGFMLGSIGPSPYGWWNTGDSFGHAGIFSSLAYGNYKTGISAAIVTNGNKSITDFFSRFVKLTNILRKA